MTPERLLEIAAESDFDAGELLMLTRFIAEGKHVEFLAYIASDAERNGKTREIADKLLYKFWFDSPSDKIPDFVDTVYFGVKYV